YGYFMAKCEKDSHLGFYQGGFAKPSDLEYDDDCNASGNDPAGGGTDTVAVSTAGEYNKEW
ncbi:MAG: hypothetical protein SPK94_05930, partial [Bacteroidales bacterium]|nr:hypothetical protein [Bacteroidales bacterium]